MSRISEVTNLLRFEVDHTGFLARAAGVVSNRRLMASLVSGGGTSSHREEDSVALIRSPLLEGDKRAIGEALQRTVVDLTDLGLVGKQVHWTVVGRNFRSVHLQLDEVVDTAREYADATAERAAAIGVLPDGRVEALYKRSGVPQPPLAWTQAQDAIVYFVTVFEEVVTRMRRRVAEAEPDLVTQDLLIEVTGALEKHYWMWQAEDQSR